MIRADNIRRIGAAGGLPDIMRDIEKWHRGEWRAGAAQFATGGVPLNQDEIWDILIRTSPELHHDNLTRTAGGSCTCWRCRPNRRYR